MSVRFAVGENKKGFNHTVETLDLEPSIHRRRIKRCQATSGTDPRIDSSALLPQGVMPTYLPHLWSCRPIGPAGEEQRDEEREHGSTQGINRGGGFAVPGQ